MNRITPEHLARGAYVYVRQSTADQLLNNPESRRRQYALEIRAKSLGWENVIVIDDDLGLSGGGQVRPGFERLLAAICAGGAGAVLAIEASRLARNGRDWHTLLEFCALVNSLIIDEDGIYDPRLINDRLLLGLKGTFELWIAIAGVVALRTAGVMLEEISVGIIDAAARQVGADHVVLAGDLRKPIRRLDGVELAVDVDLLHLVDQDDGRVALLRNIAGCDLDREPVVRAVAVFLHQHARLGAVGRDIGPIAG
jgi:hypothetical protein